MARLDYVVQRIREARIEDYPFRHLHLDDLFSAADFAEITGAPEVAITPAETDAELIAKLHGLTYQEIQFPGTTTDIPAYLAWHADRAGIAHRNQPTCEGFGVTLRLQKTRPDSILAEAQRLFKSAEFWDAAASKFGVSLDGTRTDTGLQKYLDGYEISPHPDIRLKALTFMININPAPDAEYLDYHTTYLTFRPERDYVRQFWETNQDLDRCWVPWDWCTIRKRQTRNNSMVLFSPGNDTLHAVKASYNHLATQRTQFYGNLWFKERPTRGAPNFADFARMMPVMA